MEAANQLLPRFAIAPVCEALGLSRATFYRRRQPPKVKAPKPCSHRALSEKEKQLVLSTLKSERFRDQAPSEIYATLLDEGIYLCSIRTMYRLLAEANQVRERRNQLRHPNYQKPELLATASNQLWSWDITLAERPG